MKPLILIIEDDEMIRSNLFDFLELENFNCLTAENGLIGLKLARQFNPDLIISDMNMPQLDGSEVLKSLRQDFRTARIPVIFMTANTDENNRDRAWQLGANDYLTKPISFSKLLTAINKQLKNLYCLS
jgi:DNA-binding response OmpR family regulator